MEEKVALSMFITHKPIYMATMNVSPKNALDDLQAIHKSIYRTQKAKG